MRAWMVIAAVAVLGAAAGGAWYGLEIYPQQQFRAGLDQTIASLPAGTTATYKTARYSVLTHRAVTTGWTVHGTIQADPPLQFDISVDSVETDNPNLDFAAVWGRAQANPGAFGPDSAIPVADAVAVRGLTFRSAIINGSEESAGITKFRVYPWALLHDGMPSWTDIQAALTPRNRPPELDDLRAISRAEAAMMLGVGWDSHEAGSTKVRETLPGIDIEYDIHKIAGGSFDRGIMQGGSGDGISVSGNELGVFSVDRIAVGAIDMRQPMTRLVNGEPLSPALLDGFKIGRLEYSGLTVRPPGQAEIHAGRLWLGPLAFAQGMPVAGELGWTDVVISKSQLPDARAREAFEKLGLDTMTISFAAAYDWDLLSGHAVMRDTMMRINELGTLALGVELTDVAAGAEALTRARLVHASLRFDDASLVDRLLRAGAAQSGANPAAYRVVIEALVRQRASAIGGGSPAISAAGQAVSDFIGTPGSLTVELAPPQPVPVAALQGLSTAAVPAAATLGLKVTASQK